MRRCTPRLVRSSARTERLRLDQVQHRGRRVWPAVVKGDRFESPPREAQRGVEWRLGRKRSEMAPQRIRDDIDREDQRICLACYNNLSDVDGVEGEVRVCSHLNGTYLVLACRQVPGLQLVAT